MSTEAITVETRPRRGSHGLRLFVHQLRGEQLVFWRSKEAALFIFLFPLLLFLLLGSVYSGKIYGVPASQALLAGLIGYGCANTAFAGLAIQLVIRRENAILKRLRATPLPASTYIAALLVSTLLVFALQTLALFLMGKRALQHAVPERRRLTRRRSDHRRRRVRAARCRNRVDDPFGGRLVRRRQLHPPADGVPQRRVRADAALPRRASARSATCCR